MSERSKAVDDKSKKFRWVGPLLGVLFSIGWIVLIAAVFGWLLGVYGSKPADRVAIVAALDGLIWPVAVIALGVPIIAFVWFGGSEALTKLSDLRKHLSKLDDYVTSFDQLEEMSKRINNQLGSASKDIKGLESRLTEVLDKTKTSPIQRGESLPHTTHLHQDVEALETDEMFDLVFGLANYQFYDDLSERNAKNEYDELYVTQGGWNKDKLVQEMIDEEFYRDIDGSQRIAPDVMREVFELEKGSRRSGRKNIDRKQLIDLYKKVREYLQ